MEVTKMSIKEYVAYRQGKGNKISTVAVSKAIRNGNRTPGIKMHEKYGGTYVLYVDLIELDSYLVCLKKPTTLHA